MSRSRPVHSVSFSRKHCKVTLEKGVVSEWCEGSGTIFAIHQIHPHESLVLSGADTSPSSTVNQDENLEGACGHVLLKQEKYFHREFSNVGLDAKDVGWGNQRVFHC